MSTYSKICPECTEKLEGEFEYCPNCSEKLPERLKSTGFINLIASDLAKRYLNFYNSDLILTIIFHLIVILTSFFVIPPFISNSYVFAAIIIYLTIISLLKELGHYLKYIKYLVILTKFVAFTHLGSGIAILISSTGFSRFPSFSHHFHLETIYSEITSNSPYFLIIGLLFAFSVFTIFKRFKSLV